MKEHDLADLPASDLRDGSSIHVVYNAESQKVIFYEICQREHFSSGGEPYPEVRRKLFALSLDIYLLWMGVPEWIRDAIDFSKLKDGTVSHVFYDADTEVPQ